MSTVTIEGYLGVSTPDRYQSPSPANLPPHSHLNRPTYLHDYPSNDTYDVPDEYPSALPVSMAMNASLGYDLYDTPSPEAKLVEFHADTTFQGQLSVASIISLYYSLLLLLSTNQIRVLLLYELIS